MTILEHQADELFNALQIDAGMVWDQVTGNRADWKPNVLKIIKDHLAQAVLDAKEAETGR